MASENPFEYALSSNAAWAGYKNHQNPKFFPTLAQGQSPSILWLGCSDSRVPETTVLGLQPGDVFVHRNIANIINASDINSSAVIEYAVAHLKVKHIVLCGHTCCGGAAAALGSARVGGVLDTWLSPLKAVVRQNEAELESIKDSGERAIRLAELNVKRGVEVLLGNHVVEEAVKERGLKVHGVVFDVGCGKIRDLRCGNAEDGKGEEEVEQKFDGASASAKAEKQELVEGKHGMLVFSGKEAKLSIA
ncbi:carbonic anhydrase protein [Rutstroemia sp. NJR-2017a BBW]|nr:carbonic anhydrase protein [Rutstroemia sp. NJR-2017a BBW]